MLMYGRNFQDLGPNVLLTEGKTDCHVVLALRDAYHLAPDTFGFFACGSDVDVLKRLGVVVTGPQPQRPAILGVLLDADETDVAGRWRAIQGKLSAANLGIDLYDLPATVAVAGTIVDAKLPDYPRLGFWLMPNNQDPGMLEDFCRTMMPDGAAEQAEKCLAAAKAANFTTYREAHHTKAVVHTYLGWQDEPGKPLGQAITAQALRPQTPIASAFAAWLRTLFLPTESA